LEGPETLTLAELEVYPSEELRVVSLGIHDDNDIDSVFAAASGRPGGKREVEMGFKNTALLSSAPLPAAPAAGGEGSAGEGETAAIAGSEGDAGAGVKAEMDVDAQDIKMEQQGE
jgi:hypothetical protein